ncbi:hypothetical protein K435DRAFT_802330 [Dendrothele bispora CBS 962.96]|uniref:HAT C-terminal dimerisation domain-containing protein n=1 Tax=Dendrothele bispora (strain CBS 962.96) TaxID=1314807 RepID=A0A4S8LL76_DENBC|nr:hypothetical protein K435DRAFT_802330 [Dendrothele bispora CBS 962.96]
MCDSLSRKTPSHDRSNLHRKSMKTPPTTIQIQNHRSLCQKHQNLKATVEVTAKRQRDPKPNQLEKAIEESRASAERKKAERIAKQGTKKWYKPSADPEPFTPQSIPVDEDDPFAELFESQSSMSVQADALEEYLASPLVDLKNNKAVQGDPLKWWCLKLKSKIDSVDPHLTQMAIDLLSIPDVEQDFSRAGLMVMKQKCVGTQNTGKGKEKRVVEILDTDDEDKSEGEKNGSDSSD